MSDQRLEGNIGRMVTMMPGSATPKPSEPIGECVTMRPREEARPKKEGRFQSGDLILGRYQVLAELGQGGMGVVYKCFDKTSEMEVAVKGLPPEVSHDKMSMDDIRENFQLVSGLRHQGIVGIRNLEADARTGDYYLVMDIAPGVNLHSWAKKHTGPEYLGIKLKIVEEIAAALDYAHSQRIMHRDIKPENVTIDADGHVHVLDFGLASQIHSSMSRVSLVVRSQSGTPSYKAPEQWRGQPQNAATDQYSLGVLAYMLIAGHLPFDSDDMEILRMSVLQDPVAAISGVPAHINAALARAMAKSRDQRFASCSDFALALAGKKAVGGAGVGVPTSGFGVGKVFLVAALVVVALVAVAVYRVFSGRDGNSAPPQYAPPQSALPSPAPGASQPRDPVDLALEAFRRDDYQAGYHYAMSTDRKHPKLQCYLGMCYDQQEPLSRAMKIAKDDWTAKTWYEKAAKQGDARAMTYLGKFFENGRGCDGKDYTVALEWFKKAADKDYPEGKANLHRLMKRLHDEEAAAKKRELAEKKRMEEEQKRIEEANLAAQEKARRERERKEAKARETAAQKAEEERRLEDLRRHGYTIETSWLGKKTAVWKEGVTLPEHPHWITSANERKWRVEDGYAKIDPDGKVFSPVVWRPGWMKTRDSTVKAGEVEGTWLHHVTCPSCGGRRNVASSGLCRNCGGKGQVNKQSSCQMCGGSGRVSQNYRCNACVGNGRVSMRCSSCGGSGGSACPSCNGAGRVQNPAAAIGGLVNIFAGGRGRRGIPTGPQYVACSACGGQGRIRCGACGGNGIYTVNCNTCGGRGVCTQSGKCSGCGGGGAVNNTATCPYCRGSGRSEETRPCQQCQGMGSVWQ